MATVSGTASTPSSSSRSTSIGPSGSSSVRTSTTASSSSMRSYRFAPSSSKASASASTSTSSRVKSKSHASYYNSPTQPHKEEDVLSAFPAPPKFIPSSSSVSSPTGGLPPSAFHYPGSALKKSRRESSGSTRSRESTRSAQSVQSAQSLAPSIGSSRGTSNNNKDSLSINLNGQHFAREGRDRSNSPCSSNRAYVTAPNSPMYPSNMGDGALGPGAGEESSSSSTTTIVGANSPRSSDSSLDAGVPASSRYESRGSPMSSSPGCMSPIAEVFIPSSPRTSSLPKHDQEYVHARDKTMTIDELTISRPPRIGAPPKVPLPPLPPPSSYTSNGKAPSLRSVRSTRSEKSGDGSRKSLHQRKLSGASMQSVTTVNSVGTTTSNGVAPSFAEFGVASSIAHGENGGEDEISRRKKRRESGSSTIDRELLRKLNEERKERREERRARVAKSEKAVPLKIDIPPSGSETTTVTVGSIGGAEIDASEKSNGYMMNVEESEKRKNINVSVPGTSNSATSELPPHDGETRSPTTSVFSTTSGMSAAQSLRDRLSGALEALQIASYKMQSRNGGSEKRVDGGFSRKAATRAPPVSLQTRARGESIVAGTMHIHIEGDYDDSGLLTAEDLTKEPLLARAVTPVTPRGLGGGNGGARVPPSPSPLELSNLGATYREMQRGTRSPPLPLRKQTLSPIPPLSLSDVEDAEESQVLTYRPKWNDSVRDISFGQELLSPGLLGQFPSTPVMAPKRSVTSPDAIQNPSSAFVKNANCLGVSSAGSDAEIGGAAEGSNVTRTISQSRRKPLPPDPNLMSISVSTPRAVKSFKDAKVATLSSSSFGSGKEEGSKTPARGRTMALERDRSQERGDGSRSPDITEIMSSTPKTIRSKSASTRSASSIRSTKRTKPKDPRLSQSQSQRTSRASSSYSSKSVPILRMSTGGRGRVRSDYDDAYGGVVLDEPEHEDVDPDASVVDYGFAIARHRGGYDLSPSPLHVTEELEVDEFGILHDKNNANENKQGGGDDQDHEEREADEDQGEGESDSDIDLHTPLPHILLREGVLSPYSRVLTSENSNGLLSTRSSVVGPLNGRESIASHATGVSCGSVMTKSGLFKDARDTETRRRRHRDGNQLRGGLGLTTGLGWSDSEDEDAPSPLVTKLSLSRSGSMASVRSVKSKRSQFMMSSTPPLPVSRSASSMSLRSSVAPNLSKLQSVPHSLSKSLSSANLARHGRTALQTKTSALGDVSESRSMSPTPTSSSSASLPFPSTPRDDLYGESVDSGLDDVRKKKDSSSSSVATPKLRVKTPTTGMIRPSQSSASLRPRTFTSKSAPSSAVSSISDDAVTVRVSSRVPITSTSSPRPLRLPALQKQLLSQSDSSEFGNEIKNKQILQPGQPASRSGSILGYNRNLHDRQRAEAGQHSLSAPNSAYPTSPISPASSSYSSVSYTSSSPSSSTATAKRMYGSMPTVSSLRPPATPSRMPSIGRSRTGTGMVYRQSSLPQSRVSVARTGAAI